MAVFHLISTTIMLNEWVEQTVADQELESDLQAAMHLGHDGYDALHENTPTLRQQQHNDDDDASDSSPSARDNMNDRSEQEQQLQKSASLRMRLKLKGQGDATGMTVSSCDAPPLSSSPPLLCNVCMDSPSVYFFLLLCNVDMHSPILLN